MDRHGGVIKTHGGYMPCRRSLTKNDQEKDDRILHTKTQKSKDRCSFRPVQRKGCGPAGGIGVKGHFLPSASSYETGGSDEVSCRAVCRKERVGKEHLKDS